MDIKIGAKCCKEKNPSYLITDLWNSHRSHTDLAELVAVVVDRDHDRIDDTGLAVTQERTGITFHELLRRGVQLILVLWQHNRFTDDHIITGHTGARRNDAVVLQLVVDRISHALTGVSMWLFELLLLIAHTLALGVLVGAIEDRSEEATIDRRGVQNDRIFLVVAGVGHDRHDRIDAGRQLPETQVLHRTRGDQRLLRVVEHVRQRVHSNVEVGYVDTPLCERGLEQKLAKAIDFDLIITVNSKELERDRNSHCLLSHSGLVGVTWRLVVIWERNDRGTDAKYHRWMNLTMSAGRTIGALGGGQIVRRHGNHRIQLPAHNSDTIPGTSRPCTVYLLLDRHPQLILLF